MKDIWPLYFDKDGIPRLFVDEIVRFQLDSHLYWEGVTAAWSRRWANVIGPERQLTAGGNLWTSEARGKEFEEFFALMRKRILADYSLPLAFFDESESNRTTALLQRPKL